MCAKYVYVVLKLVIFAEKSDIMDLKTVKELLSNKGHQAFHTASEINAYVFYSIKNGLPVHDSMEIRTGSLDEFYLEKGLVHIPDISEEERSAILCSRIPIMYEILKEEIDRSRSAVGPLLEEYISRSSGADDDYYIQPSPLIVKICDYLSKEDPSHDAKECIPAFDRKKHRSIVADMTMYQDARFIFSHMSGLVDAAFTTYNYSDRDARLFFLFRADQRWDKRDRSHFLHMCRYLSDVYEVGNLILLEYKRSKPGAGKTVSRLHYSEKEMTFEEDARNVYPSSRPRLYYLASLNGGGRNHKYKLASERDLMPDEYYVCQVGINHKLRQGESWMPWKGPRSSGDPTLLKVRNEGMLTGEKVVEGPVIIVNLDTYRAFAYWNADEPYLLEDNEKAFIVDHGESVYRFAKSMNDRLAKMFYDIEHDRRLTPLGKRYHLTSEEKVYVILHGAVELTKRMSRKPASDNRFGYDERTWNSIIENEDRVNAFIMALNTEEDEKSGGPIIRVEKCEDGNFKLTKNMSKRDAALFAYLVSCILGIWDYSKNKNDDDSGTDRCYVGKDLSFNDNCFRNTSSMCSSYFDVRFSLPKDTIRKSKKYALDCLSTLREGRDWPDACGEAAVVKAKAIFNLVTKTTLKLH